MVSITDYVRIGDVKDGPMGVTTTASTKGWEGGYAIAWPSYNIDGLISDMFPKKSKPVYKYSMMGGSNV